CRSLGPSLGPIVSLGPYPPIPGADHAGLSSALRWRRPRPARPWRIDPGTRAARDRARALPFLACSPSPASPRGRYGVSQYGGGKVARWSRPAPWRGRARRAPLHQAANPAQAWAGGPLTVA